MSSYAVSKRNDWFDFVTLILDVLSPLYAFLLAPQTVAASAAAPEDNPAEETWEPTPADVPEAAPEVVPARRSVVTPAEPTEALPGTDEKLAVMAARMAAGERAYHPEDAGVAPLPEVGELYCKRGGGKATRYVPLAAAAGTEADDGRRFRRRRSGARWVYDLVD